MDSGRNPDAVNVESGAVRRFEMRYFPKFQFIPSGLRSLQLTQDGRNVDDGQVGTLANQAIEEIRLLRGKVEARDPACRVAIEHPRRRQDKEIRPHGIPVDLAETHHPHPDRAADDELDAVTDRQTSRRG
ncbi:hypothetical protein ACCAA_760049 [Candidatus Accumulibacter aalborgensis]|uniref:Uncharacterized protein n=1 Tax=Candidatus Accumulibacter aalborgensis TaxID=1860102 RepID=A0A1A8Y0B1_9PROT|nr:hypothetical protein [Candidatus Accumulibacter aalborgensis]SBT09763.1 hypothetical protein ACCAA_760049 [Candidatus Accumulibacter aalborgensis]